MAACTYVRSNAIVYAVILVGILTADSQRNQVTAEEYNEALVDIVNVATPVEPGYPMFLESQEQYSSFSDDDLPEVAFESEVKEPTHLRWINPALYNKRSIKSLVKRSSTMVSAASHHRVKRSEDQSDVFQFELRAMPPYDSYDATFKYGDVISYQCVITASSIEKDIMLEIYTELDGGAFFMISNVRFGHVGSNLDTFDTGEKEILYYSVYNDGRYDRATINLGAISNSMMDTSDDLSSEIELLFEVQVLAHGHWMDGESYRVSIGALIDSEIIAVVQDTIEYDSDYTTWDIPDSKFTVTGPTALSAGMTGLWTVTATLYDLSYDLTLDVLTPIDLPGVLSLDRISISSVGENYKYGVNDDTFNFTMENLKTQGDYGRIDLGTILNAGYHTQDYDAAHNTITFEVAITMMEHEFDDSSLYPISFVLYNSVAPSSVEILWTSDEQSLQPTDDAYPEMIISADFMIWPNSDAVSLDGFFGVVINMSIPVDTITSYLVEVNVPVHMNNSVMNIERVRVSRIGFNFPHLEKFTDYEVSKISRDGTNIDYLTMNFADIRNTGQRDEEQDQIVQIEVGIRLLDTVSEFYSMSDTVAVDVGVTHNEKIYWVDVVDMSISDLPLSYELTETPKFSMANVMGRDYNISAEAGGVVDLDIVVPAGASYDSLKVEFDSANKSEEQTTLKIVGIEFAHAGNSLIFRGDESGYYGDGETEVNHDPVYNFANRTLIYLTSLTREDSARYDFEDRTLRIRAFVVCRGRTAHLLNDGDVLWLSATVTVSDEYIYAGRVGLFYSATSPDYYTNFDWQPDIDMRMSDGYRTNVVRRGAVLRYNIAVNLPYKTSADLDVRIESNKSPVQVCQVLRRGSGKAIVDYLPPNTTDAEISYDSISQRHFESYLNIPSLTSFSYDTYTDLVGDAFVNFTAIVMLEETAVANETYNFLTEVTLGQLSMVTFQPNVVATDALPSILERPKFELIHHMETETINVGGSEIIYFDMYIPPATSHKYHVIIQAPWNETFYGEYKILHAFMVSVGSDLACFNGYTTNVTIPVSEGDDNKAVFATSYIANVAADRFVLRESNKVRLAVHVALIANTSIAVGDSIPITVTVDMNDGADIFLDKLNLQVIPPEDVRNTILPSNLTLDITAHEDRVFSVGERQYFHALTRVPPGMAVTQFQIVVESLMVGDETLLTVEQPNITKYGSNMLELGDHVHFHNETDFLQPYSQTMDFGFLRNLGIVNQSTFIDATSGEDDLEFEFSIRLMDHVTLYDGRTFPFKVFILYGNDTVVNATGDTTITVSAPDSDTTNLFWNVYIKDDPLNLTYFDTVISFGLDIGITNLSRRFPDNVTVFYRVPFISSVVADSMTFIGLEHEYQATAAVNQYGLQFQFNRLRFDYIAHINFSVVVDPDSYMEFGLLNRHMDVPVDIRYYEERKNSPGDFVELFTGVSVLEYEVYIPECLDSLGVADGTIKACQFFASIDDGLHAAQDGRLGSSSGWATQERGPPLYQHEYIQVDLGAQVRISAITIQPFNDVQVSRITSFKLQYSWEGIRWEYLMESGVEKVFSVAWDVNVTVSSTVTVELGDLAFLTRFVRILPQENADGTYAHKLRFDIHGCPWPYKSVIPTYTCPPVSTAPLKTYDVRQMLAVNESIFVCMISELNDLPYCSGSNDLGQSWFAIDDNVMNVLGYETSKDTVYGLARNRESTLRSTDKGHTWYTIEENDFAAMSSLPDYMAAKALPFPLNGASLEELLDAYGEETEASYTWAASNQALHAYPDSKEETVNAGKTTADDQVGRWGSTEWN